MIVDTEELENHASLVRIEQWQNRNKHRRRRGNHHNWEGKITSRLFIDVKSRGYKREQHGFCQEMKMIYSAKRRFGNDDTDVHFFINLHKSFYLKPNSKICLHQLYL